MARIMKMNAVNIHRVILKQPDSTILDVMPLSHHLRARCYCERFRVRKLDLLVGFIDLLFKCPQIIQHTRLHTNDSLDLRLGIT